VASAALRRPGPYPDSGASRDLCGFLSGRRLPRNGPGLAGATEEAEATPRRHRSMSRGNAGSLDSQNPCVLVCAPYAFSRRALKNSAGVYSGSSPNNLLTRMHGSEGERGEDGSALQGRPLPLNVHSTDRRAGPPARKPRSYVATSPAVRRPSRSSRTRWAPAPWSDAGSAAS
jgi:hypothetical protein